MALENLGRGPASTGDLELGLRREILARNVGLGIFDGSSQLESKAGQL